MTLPALLLIAHGSRNAKANEDLHHVARGMVELGYKVVVPSYLELAEPSIQEGGRQCIEQGATQVVLVPYFLSAGVHFLRDLKTAREDLQAAWPGVRFVLAEPLGRHPGLLRIVSERASEAIQGMEE